MSYILDALKKSDRERQRGEIPGLHSIHDPYPDSNDSHLARHWPKYIAVLGLLVLISIAAATWHRTHFSPVSQKSTAIDLAGTTAELKIDIPSLPVTELPDIASPTVESLTADSSSAAPSLPKLTTRSKKIILLPEKPDPPQKNTAKASPAPEKSPDIPDISKLPPLVRSDIPDLNLVGHTYSEDPSKRMIIINNNILREGDRVNESIRLVEITWTGVVLDYNGSQFTIDTE